MDLQSFQNVNITCGYPRFLNCAHYQYALTKAGVQDGITAEEYFGYLLYLITSVWDQLQKYGEINERIFQILSMGREFLIKDDFKVVLDGFYQL